MTRHYILRGIFVLAIGFLIGAVAVAALIPEVLIWVGAGIILAMVLLSATSKDEL